MKFLEAKQSRQQVDNKMTGGSAEDKTSKPNPQAGGRVIVRPEVQALADELNIDLSTVRGTGAGASITKADVRKAAQQASDPSGA